MGLDQYAFATYKKLRVKKVLGVVVESEKSKKKEDFFYWRKHPNLQGWMENLYREKGGKGDFNCKNVELKKEDLDRLENELNRLPQTSGFFFGESLGTEEERTNDKKFVDEARKRLEKGWQIYYTSWW